MKKLLLFLVLISGFTACRGLGGLKDDSVKHPADDAERSTESSDSDDVDSDSAAAENVDVAVGKRDTAAQKRVIAAIQSQDLDSLKTLLDEVDDVKTIVGDEVLLLHMAEEAMGVSGLENPIAKFLVEKKAYILQRDEKGRSWERVIQEMEVAATPRHEYIRTIIGDKFSRRYHAVMTDDLAAFKRYVQYGPMDGALLWEACRAKASNIAVYMVEQGADVTYVNPKTHQSVLQMACSGFTPAESTKNYKDFAPIIAALIKAGADVNVKDDYGVTPLLELMKTELGDNPDTFGDPKHLVQMLIEAGADPSIPNSTGDTALESAVRDFNFPNPKIVQLMLDGNGKITDRIIGVGVVNLPIIQLLIDHGADVHAMARTRRTFFDDEAGQLQYYRYMMSMGADANDFDLRSSTTYPKNAEYLIDLGAGVSVRYHKNKTLLHIAVQNSVADLVDILISAGSDVNALDDAGRTPLDELKSGQEKIASALREAGALHGKQLASQSRGQ